MDIILVYLALASFIAAIAGLFIPQKLIFWCAPDDRNRAMAFTVYLTLSIILSITFIVIVPEQPAPVATIQNNMSPTAPAQLTGPVFLDKVRQHLESAPNFELNEFVLSLLVFGKEGVTCQLLSSSYPNNEIAKQHATQVVKEMILTLKNRKWKIDKSFLAECQIQIDEAGPTSKNPIYRVIGFARYNPDTGDITWMNLN